MESNDELVDSLVERGYIESDKVEEAFRNVDRKNFLPEDQKWNAYVDTPLPIAGDSINSAPSVIAENTELLDLKSDNRVIEIGSGSGYQLAIIAEIVDNEVIGVDVIEEVVENSRERLDYENVTVYHGNGFNPVEGDFDRILYSCAIDSFNDAGKHLREGGIAVAPVNIDHTQTLQKLEEGEISEYSSVKFMHYREEGVQEKNDSPEE
jgi:protein-L-isoaspartate(D-aspartate) O-methyltransferase